MLNCYPQAARLNKQFKFADRMGIRLVLVIGPDESANDQVTIKDLVQGSQQVVERAKVARRVKEILA